MEHSPIGAIDQAQVRQPPGPWQPTAGSDASVEHHDDRRDGTNEQYRADLDEGLHAAIAASRTLFEFFHVSAPRLSTLNIGYISNWHFTYIPRDESSRLLRAEDITL